MTFTGLSKIALVLWALLPLFVPSEAVAQSGESGQVCVGNYLPFASCTATDVRITSIAPISTLVSCGAGSSTATAVFDVTVVAGAARQDIGVFVAVDGGNAVGSGQCFHDYLQPPLVASPAPITSYHGPWRDKDADGCGDMDASSQIVKDLNPSGGVTILCDDTNGDGIVDVSVCTSWDTSSVNACSGVQGAIPLSFSKCWCGRVNVGIPSGGGGSVDGLTMGRTGPGTLTLSWAPSCDGGDTDYEVYEGDLGNFSSHRSVLCSSGGTRSASVPEPPGSVYYLAVPRSTAFEGSYGRATSGQRPAAGSACFPQHLSACGSAATRAPRP